MITILVIIVVLAAIICILWTVHRQDELDDMEAELTAQSLALDERANRIAADEQTLRSEWETLRNARASLYPSGDAGSR